MIGSEFVARYAAKGPGAWEAAAIALGKEPDGLCPWPWIEVELRSAAGDVAILKVQSDVLAVGSIEDHVRLPLTPGVAQAILNDSALYPGALLPTPWLAYQIWRAAPVKLAPTAMVPNLGANLTQYGQHSSLVDGQVSASGVTGGLVSGHKKAIVVANFYQPKKVLIFGWYRPPPAADVFDDGTSMTNPKRQPIQPRSNVHGDFYVDYSHGIRAIHPEATVNGQSMGTEELYRHPTLSALVSNEGPVRVTRYPSPVRAVPFRPAIGDASGVASYPASGGVIVAPADPPGGLTALGFAVITRREPT